jgi:hypothetical protein
MSTALIVSLLGITGLTLESVERKQTSIMNDRLFARSNARSAVELALLVIANDSDWRNTYTNGQETTPQLLGASEYGTVSWVLEDSDGSLTDADTELRLKGVGRVDNVVHVSSVEIAGPPMVLDTLLCSVYSAGNMDQSSNTTTNSGPFATAGTFTVDTDDSDQYTPLFCGLFHVIGSGVHATLSSNQNINGVFISEGTASLSSNLDVTVDPNIFSNPPTGYTASSGDVQAVMGSWRWDIVPTP